MPDRRPQSSTSSTGNAGEAGDFGFPLPAGLADPLLLTARVLLGYVFVIGGWGKLTGLAGFSAYLERQGVPASYALAALGAAVEFLGGVALVLGIAARYAALALIAFTLAATGIAHRFWEFDQAARGGQVISFNKNMAMVGGFIAVLVAGAGRYSLDHVLARRRI
jgi:putative oxidoreductase